MAKNKNTGNKGFMNRMFNGTPDKQPIDVVDNKDTTDIEAPKKKVGNSFSAMLEQRKTNMSKRNKEIHASAKVAHKERIDFESKMKGHGQNKD